MNIKAMKLWIKALSSGNYQQCRGTIKKSNIGERSEYCCLGVAVRAYELDTGKKFDWRMWNVAGAEKESGINFLPRVVQEWLGIGTKNPSLVRYITATDANDAEMWTFKKIAAALEKKYIAG